MKQIVFLTVFLLSQLTAKEYFLHLNKGWQLIGLPTNTGNMRIFNNDNVRLVWAFDNKYNEWIGYSPQKDIRNRLDNARVNSLNNIKSWQGIWIFSNRDWDLEIEDNPKLGYNYPKIDIIELFEGWNLISLPFDSVFSAKLFDGYKVWRYGQYEGKSKSNWQTNQKYTRLNFPEIDEMNGKSGFWVYSPEYREIDLSQESAEFLIQSDSVGMAFSKFESLDEVSKYIKNSLFVSNRNNKYWNWTPKKSDSVENEIKTVERLSNSITNSNIPNIQDDIKKPENFIISDSRVYYISGDKKSILIEHLDNLLFNRQEPIKFTPNFTFGEYQINSFLIEGNKLIVISDLQDDKINPSFESQCRAKKIVVSIYELNFNNITKSTQKYIFIDGSLETARIVDSNLYLLTEFKPCIQLDYEKKYLSNSDMCSYPPFDTINYQTLCYDVEVDSTNQKRFRYNYETPEIVNTYTLPKYETSGKRFDLVKSDQFFTSTKLDRNSSIFSISHIDTISGKLDLTSSIFGDIDNIYLSENHIYFTSDSSPEHLSFWETRAKTDIYEFSFYPKIEYLAFGNVGGKVLNKFSLNESNEYLQIASIDKYSWNEPRHDNRLTVFQKQNKSLESINHLDNIVNEAYPLTGIKFYGNIAITSTNSKNQPLQIIDLQNETSPSKGGTLEIAGTSEMIYFSQAEKRIFSFGREISDTLVNGGIELDIIDINNIQKPKLAKQKIFGDYFNFTPLFIDSKTLGYSDSNNILAIPIYQDGGTSLKTTSTGIHLTQINKLESGAISISPYISLPKIDTPTADKHHQEVQTIFLDRNSRSYVLYLIQGKLNAKRIQ